MKNLKRLAAVFAASAALLAVCNPMGEEDRYSFECLGSGELSLGTLRAPRGYDVTLADGPQSKMQLVAVSGSDKFVEPTPIPNGSDCSLTKMLRR